jgi:signal transduction histidine kinase
MMTENNKSKLGDVLNEFMALDELPDAATLEKWVTRYPQFRRDLIDFAAAWAEQEYLPEAPELGAEAEKRLIDRAMSHVQNVAFSRDSNTEPSERPVESLTAEAKAAGMNAPEFAKACGLDLALLTKLNNRAIRVRSIPASLIRHVAREIRRPVAAVQAYLERSPSPTARQSYVARRKPDGERRQESFAEAVRASSLSDAAKASWLDEAAGLEES